MAFHDYPGFAGVNETWKAVYKKVISKPEKWRLISDRDAGSIIAFERIKEGSKFDSKKLLRNRLKWK